MSFTVIAPARGDKNAPPHTEEFATYWYNKMLSVTGSLTVQPNLLAATYEQGAQTQVWRLLKKKDGTHFQTFDEFCETKKPWGLETSPAYIRNLLALAEGKAVAAAITAPELKAPGGNRHQVSNRNLKSETKPAVPIRGGTNVEYRAARLKRDAPEVAARLARGEFPSVSAAFREAGLERKPDPVRSVVRKTERLPPERLLEAAWEIVRRLSASDLAELVSRVQSLLKR